MVRFKTRWLLLAIDDKPLATSSPFHAALDDSAHASSSVSILSSAQKATRDLGAAATLTPQLITRLLRASLVTNFGDVAAGAFGGALTCKYYSTHTGTAIVRCSRDAARLVWASATLISSPVEMSPHDSADVSANSASIRIRVIHCGGTIKKAQNKAIELDRKLILRLRAKQKKLATDSIRAPSPNATLLDVSPADQKPLASSPIPIASVDDDEDLGEALDPDAPGADDDERATTTSTAALQATQADRTTTTASKRDSETQTLLAQSRKQINSISM